MDMLEVQALDMLAHVVKTVLLAIMAVLDTLDQLESDSPAAQVLDMLEVPVLVILDQPAIMAVLDIPDQQAILAVLGIRDQLATLVVRVLVMPAHVEWTVLLVIMVVQGIQVALGMPAV
jgi:hypothetical protein